MMHQNRVRQSSDNSSRSLQPVSPAQPQYERLLRLPEVMALTGLKRSSLYLKISQSEFPSQVKIGDRASAWKLSEIQHYIQSRPSKGAV